MFRKPLPNALLRSMRLLPIFRARDARASVAREGNNSTYDECLELFRKDQLILIFSEGDSFPEKSVRQLKNGTAAMALELYRKSEGELDLYVLPCGINYSRFGERGRVHISFAEAIRVADLKEEMEADSRKLTTELTQQIQSSIESVVFEKDTEQGDLYDFAQDLALNEATEPMFFLQKERGASKAATVKPGETCSDYQRALKKYKVHDRNVNAGGFDFPALFLVIFTFLVSLPSFILYKLMWMGSKRFTLSKVKNPVFQDSIYFGMGMVSSYLMIILVLTFSFILYSGFWAWVISFAAIGGMLAWFNLIEEWPFIVGEFRYMMLSQEKKEELKRLRSQSLNFD